LPREEVPDDELRGNTVGQTDPSLVDMNARFAWARQQGHASYLWPDVPVDAWRACMREIERATALVLAGASRVTLAPPPGANDRAIGIAAFTSGMGPLLGHWVRTGELIVGDDLATILDVHFVHGQARSGKMAAALERTLDLLEEASIRTVVVKASHTSTEYFPAAGTRPAADIDIVVPAGMLQAAIDVLEKADYLTLETRRRPPKADLRPPGVSAESSSIDFTHSDNPFTIELHSSADRTFAGVRTLRFGPLDTRNTRPAPEIHQAAHVFVQPWLTVFLAAHASEELHQLQLVRIVELVWVIKNDVAAGRLDVFELRAMLRWLGAMRFALPALEMAERLAPGTIDPGLRAELNRAATPRMRRVLERLGPGTAQRLEGLSLDERFLLVKGPFEMARRILHMAWPTRG
jgi:Uncharacterised nucleotidyltransferase